MTATDDEEPAPTSGEDAMFRAMFGDLMAEARAGRLTQREFQAACMARMAATMAVARPYRASHVIRNEAIKKRELARRFQRLTDYPERLSNCRND